jgi:hypothetical protein
MANPAFYFEYSDKDNWKTQGKNWQNIKNWTDIAASDLQNLADHYQSLYDQDVKQHDWVKSTIDDLYNNDSILWDWKEDFRKTFNTNLENIGSKFGTLDTDIGLLKNQLTNWNTTTEIGDVQGLDDIISNLKTNYQTNQTDLANLQTNLDSLSGSVEDQIKSATDELGLNNYMKTSDFDSRMTDNLDALSQTLRGEFGDQIGSLDLEGVRQSIADQGGDLSKLTTDFSGLTSDVDWIKGIGLGGLDDRINTQGTNLTNLINQQGANFQDQLTTQKSDWKGDLTDLQNILESGRGKALANLENQLGKDRTADLLNLRQQLEEGTLTDIQAMAGNLRQEFGDDVSDLSTTFEGKLGDVQSALGGDISKLFKESGSLQSGLDTLTSGLGTTSQQLEALQGSFGDYKTDAATNLANIQQAFGKQVGDLGTDFTNQLGNLRSSTASDILGLSGDIAGARSDAATGLAGLTTQTAKDIAGAKSEAATAVSGLRSDLTDKLTAQDTAWADRLKAQDTAWQTQFQTSTDALNKRLSDISASQNYRTLGDSAQGVKIRRSRAYNTGRTRSGTGQLGRSMKISTLNI